MFKFNLTVFAVVAISILQTQAHAQNQTSSPSNQFTVFTLQEKDPEFFKNVGEVVKAFEEVCLAVYKAAVDNPDQRISQQDVNWPAAYESFTDRHKKRIGDINVDVDIDFNTTKSLLVKVTEWNGTDTVTKSKYQSFPAATCTFNLSLDANQTPKSLSAYINNQHQRQYKTLSTEAVEYAFTQANHDCSFSRIRDPLTSGKFIDSHRFLLEFSFPHEALKETSEFPFCETRLGKTQFQSGSYQITSDGYVTNPEGQTIGRLNATGDILDHHGRLIGHLKPN